MSNDPNAPQMETCPLCGGGGEILDEECMLCKGDGMLPAETVRTYWKGYNHLKFAKEKGE